MPSPLMANSLHTPRCPLPPGGFSDGDEPAQPTRSSVPHPEPGPSPACFRYVPVEPRLGALAFELLRVSSELSVKRRNGKSWVSSEL